MTDETRALRWALEVAPRLGVAGFVVGSVTLDRMVTQVADTSQGRLPAATAAARAGVYRATIAKQAAISGAQYLATREIKLALDAVHASAPRPLAFHVCPSPPSSPALGDVFRCTRCTSRAPRG